MLQVKKSCLKVQQHQLPEEERGHKQGVGLQQLHLPHPWEDEKAQVAYVMVNGHGHVNDDSDGTETLENLEGTCG